MSLSFSDGWLVVGGGRGRGIRVNTSTLMKEPDPDIVARLVGSASAGGWGRGYRVNTSTPMREPDPDIVARLVGSASAGGWGRGYRVNTSTPMREPDPDTVARLVGSASAETQVTMEGQFTDVSPGHIMLEHNEVEDPALKVLVTEILSKGESHSESFEKHIMKIEESIQQFPLSQETLQNLAEMIVHWGIGKPRMCYTASRLCQVLCEMKPIAGFNKILMRRLQVRFMKMKELVTKTAEEKEEFINFAFFYAEIFTRMRLNGSPYRVLGVAIFELVQKLLSVKEDKLVIVGCRILKSTGNLLEECEKGSTSKMDQVVEMLKKLAIDDTSLSRHCQDLVLRVIQLQAIKWGKAPPLPVNQQPPFHELIFQEFCF